MLDSGKYGKLLEYIGIDGKDRIIRNLYCNQVAVVKTERAEEQKQKKQTLEKESDRAACYHRCYSTCARK